VPGDARLAKLLRYFGQQWEIERVERGTEWEACRRNGDLIEIIVARDLAVLRFNRMRPSVKKSTQISGMYFMDPAVLVCGSPLRRTGQPRWTPEPGHSRTRQLAGLAI